MFFLVGGILDWIPLKDKMLHNLHCSYDAITVKVHFQPLLSSPNFGTVKLFAYPVSNQTLFIGKCLMTKPRSFFHYLLIGFFMLSMLMPAAHAENNDMTVHHEMSQQQHECHSDAEAQAKHATNSHCASDNCQCAATNCHASGVLSFQPVFIASLYSQNRLAITTEQLISQSPTKLERPPRS